MAKRSKQSCRPRLLAVAGEAAPPLRALRRTRRASPASDEGSPKRPRKFSYLQTLEKPQNGIGIVWLIRALESASPRPVGDDLPRLREWRRAGGARSARPQLPAQKAQHVRLRDVLGDEALPYRQKIAKRRPAASGSYKLNPGHNLGKTNALNDSDLEDFLKIQADFADSDDSWSVDAHAIDRAIWELSVKDPNKAEEAALREPMEIMDEMPALDAESAEILGAVVTEVEVSNQHHQTFESIKRTDPDGNEFWRARQIGPLLDYQDYRNFQNVVAKAKTACKTAGYVVADHFGDFTEMVPIGSGAIRRISDIRLSRYACYLIVQNGDPSKPVIALGQTYFAIQTRRQELQEGVSSRRLSEDDRRLTLRGELSEHNKALSATAKQSGVETSLDYAIFQDHGYRGLYGDLAAEEIQSRKGLKKSQEILDYMDSTELAANLFRATQTEDKLRRDGVNGKLEANTVHFEVGRKVRKTIEELGGTMPEDLPTPPKSISQIEREQKKGIARDDSGKK